MKNRPILFFAFAVASLFASSKSVAQERQPEIVNLPPLSIDGSHIDTSVTYDAARYVYRYEYTVVAAATNRAPLHAFHIDVSGRVPSYVQNDPDLQGNAYPLNTTAVQIQPPSTLPVRATVPLSAGKTEAGPNAAGEVAFVFKHWSIQPGQSVGGFAIESKYPPGIRKAVIRPSDDAWRPIVAQYRDIDPARWIEFSPNTDEKFKLTVAVIAPMDIDESKLFFGGGQQPAEVNQFLRYAQPADTRVKLPVGTTSYTVEVFYGATIDPATFSATLNGTVNLAIPSGTRRGGPRHDTARLRHHEASARSRRPKILRSDSARQRYFDVHRSIEHTTDI